MKARPPGQLPMAFAGPDRLSTLGAMLRLCCLTYGVSPGQPDGVTSDATTRSRLPHDGQCGCQKTIRVPVSHRLELIESATRISSISWEVK
jgi:hypothetical protein